MHLLFRELRVTKAIGANRDVRILLFVLLESGLWSWDVAAGAILIEEAGGRVSRYDNSTLDIYTPPIMASNGLVHEAMMRVLAS